MNRAPKILQIAAVDVTFKAFLLPLIDRLSAEGYQVHIACSPGQYTSQLRDHGSAVHEIKIERRIRPLSNLKALWHLFRLMKKERFEIVHVHTPVAAVLGRLAAWFAGVPVVIYTLHGFYFHENSPEWIKFPVIVVERLLSRVTHLVFTVSNEDAGTAVSHSIYPQDKVLCISSGVDTTRFNSECCSNGFRASVGLSSQDKVVGFVGRLVGEKGIVELVEAVQQVTKEIPDTRLLLVGDTLESDRDSKTKQVITHMLCQEGLENHVVFTGFVEDVTQALTAMDVFVLPSYREGMPVTVIEAMASGKPVIATNIRGCREEVVPGVTGLLVPVKDSKALADAIVTLLSDPEMARQMGIEGRSRVLKCFDENAVLDKQIEAYKGIVQQKLETRANKKSIAKVFGLPIKRAADIILSSISLLFLFLPFLLISALIKLDSRGPVFFFQERTGKDGKQFHIWKFRTMSDGAVNHGLGINIEKNDSRITRVGKLLRNFGLDELPQLINVFKGEMSIVGPRPTLKYQVELYDNFQRQRLLMKPGITSLAVVEGRNALSWPERIELDVKYVTNWSLWLDMKIIIKTFWAVLITRKGVYGKEGVNDDFLPKSAVRVEIDK